MDAMLAAILLATAALLVEESQPSVIEDDLLNGVKWSSAHDYEVHDHDADQENQPDDVHRSFNILGPRVPQEIQDHVPQTAGREKHQVSVEVNGDSGFVDHSLEVKNSKGYENQKEDLHHSDFDKVQQTFQSKITDESDFDSGKMEDQIKVIVLESGESPNYEQEEGETSDIGVSTHVDDASQDSKDRTPDSERSDGFVASDLESPRISNDQKPNSGPSNQNVTSKVFQISDYDSSFEQNVSTYEKFDPSSNPYVNRDSFIMSSPPTTVSEDQEQHTSSSTPANTPVLNVHLLEDTLDRKVDNKDGDSFISFKSNSRNGIKSQKDSPITRISKVASGLGPLRLVKHVIAKPTRRRVLVEVKKKVRPRQNSEDSSVSSTTDSVSTDNTDDNLDGYDEIEADTEGEEVNDLQHEPQDQTIITDPSGPRVPAEEPIPFYVPLVVNRIPVVPIHPYPEEPPTKIHQPVLHHIIHSLFSPPSHELSEDEYLQRYSPNFVPYPPYFPLPY